MGIGVNGFISRAIPAVPIKGSKYALHVKTAVRLAYVASLKSHKTLNLETYRIERPPRTPPPPHLDTPPGG